MGSTPTAQRYRKRPVTIEAMQWTGDNYPDLYAWTGNRDDGHEIVAAAPQGLQLWVQANEAWLTLETGEWIIRDSRGFYPCKPDIFAETYERSESQDGDRRSGIDQLIKDARRQVAHIEDRSMREQLIADLADALEEVKAQQVVRDAFEAGYLAAEQWWADAHPCCHESDQAERDDAFTKWRTEPAAQEKQTTCKHCDGAIHQSPKAGGDWVHSDGAQAGLHTCPVDLYGFHAEPVDAPCGDHPANPCNGARGLTVIEEPRP
ncbi:hypothetical protein [Nocardia sp. SC052]|uniref:hypothetical protein n=1 Tax=Nocardia sichangensis TaxID=3385975 RepID=UPI0039A39D8B